MTSSLGDYQFVVQGTSLFLLHVFIDHHSLFAY